MAYRSGAKNRKANSIGSVMPVRKAVSAAETMMPPTFLRCSRRAAPHMAGAAGGQPNNLKKIPARHVARRRIAGDEARNFPVHDFAIGGIEEFPGLEKERHV